jgi:hypothetical protein
MATAKRPLGEETTRIADLAVRVLEGDPWHAGNIVHLLEDVTAAEAHAHPVPAAHSIWELVLHMTAWADEVRARLAGAEAGDPDPGDWPRVGRATEARWTQARAALVDPKSRITLGDVEGVEEGRGVRVGGPADQAAAAPRDAPRLAQEMKLADSHPTRRRQHTATMSCRQVNASS